jgi:toxin ParE1/3/4
MVLRLRPEARLDLEAAVRWYAAQENGLGRMFVQEVRQAFQRIRTNPEA